MRDAETFGHMYEAARGRGLSISDAVNLRAPDYEPGPWMSAPPHEHHLANHPDVHLLASGVNLSDGAD